MRALGVIQARGGSKRLPRKNVMKLNGVPLIAYAVRAAAAASSLDRVIVSTEDDEIAAIAREYGGDVPFKRPLELAADYADDESIIEHALTFCEQQDGAPYDVVVKLHPTTPFLQPDHIDACVERLRREPEVNCCFTVSHVTEPPQWMFLPASDDGEPTLMLGGKIDGERSHTQLLDRVLIPNGGAYAIRVSAFREQRRVFSDPLRLVVMDEAHSVDIDTELDFMFAEAVGRKYEFTPIETSRK